jgi:predicted anti-sigma-YlaC factor YlaD
MGRFLANEANCAQARSWVSHEVDGELSQFERVFLAAHLRHCGECARFAEDVRSFTNLVRVAPLEQPKRAFEVPVRRPARLRVTGRVAIATALLALAGGLGVLAGSNGGRPSSQTAPEVGDVALLAIPKSADRELRDLRRVKIEQPRERVNPPGRIGGNV